MRKKILFNAEQKIKDCFKNFLIQVGADEGDTVTTTDPTPSPIATTEPVAPVIDLEKIIAQVRKEEKDKLYPQLDKLKKENGTLKSSVNQYILKIGSLKEQLESAKDDGTNLAKITELEGKIATLEEENTKLKENTPNEEEIRKKLESEYEIKNYVKDKIKENEGKILLTLFESNIKGETKEEIDNAIAEAISQTEKVRKELGVTTTETKAQNEESNVLDLGKPPKVPSAKPPVEKPNKKYTEEYIRNLDPRSAEYAEFRKSLGLK